jgi:hypothetical protein
VLISPSVLCQQSALGGVISALTLLSRLTQGGKGVAGAAAIIRAGGWGVLLSVVKVSWNDSVECVETDLVRDGRGGSDVT